MELLLLDKNHLLYIILLYNNIFIKPLKNIKLHGPTKTELIKLSIIAYNYDKIWWSTSD